MSSGPSRIRGILPWGRLGGRGSGPRDDLVDLLLEEGQLVGVEGGRIHGDQQDAVVDRDLVADRLDEPQDRDEIVVRDEVLDRVEEDHAALVAEELFDRQREFLDVLRPDRVLLPDVAKP